MVLNDYVVEYITENLTTEEIISMYKELKKCVEDFEPLTSKTVTFIRKVNQRLKEFCPIESLRITYTVEDVYNSFGSLLANRYIESKTKHDSENKSNIFAYRLDGQFTENMSEVLARLRSEDYHDIIKYGFIEESLSKLIKVNEPYYIYFDMVRCISRVLATLNHVGNVTGNDILDNMLKSMGKNSLPEVLINIVKAYRERRNALTLKGCPGDLVGIEELRLKFEEIKDVDFNNFE